MKKIVAINASPRVGWNTSAIVKETATALHQRAQRLHISTFTSSTSSPAVYPVLPVSCPLMRANAFAKTVLHLCLKRYGVRMV